MRRKTMPKTVPLEVTYTEGYQKRFTELILRIYEKKMRENKDFWKDSTKK